MSVSHFPLPYKGKFSKRLENIKELYVLENEVHNEPGVGEVNRVSTTSITYPLYLKSTEGYSIEVLSARFTISFEEATLIKKIITDYIVTYNYAEEEVSSPLPRSNNKGNYFGER
ncbi:hypothetical protein [Flammeovirga aprica]|uniref:Uncharacterized protein n=1 Tax=Flammeovirga aprica JL-4 TaxID=694437 RepID=A0A7X9XA02_9BACT|nr:hypothetical protein [Flammeovirga aprica]NME69179.1 hypothetical protein [Flammeovirga aprica JL-4]